MARKKAAKSKTSTTSLAPRRSSEHLSNPTGYVELLDEIKGRIRSAQIKAALSVNRELIELYWSIGRDIVQRQRREGWGREGDRPIGGRLTLGVSRDEWTLANQCLSHAGLLSGV
jgi:hypothetical protein